MFFGIEEKYKKICILNNLFYNIDKYHPALYTVTKDVLLYKNAFLFY